MEASYLVEHWPVARPVPYANNPREISARAVEKVADSIRAFGFRQPIVVDAEGVVVVGHARLLAAKKLGLDGVPVHVARDLTADEARAYRLADNRTGGEAAWADDALAFELAELGGAGFDLALTGFDEPELGRLAGPGEGLTDPDDAPVAPDVAVTRPGDAWAMDGHRALCGDATAEAAVDTLLGGAAPHLMVTDPPYGVEYDAGWRKRVSLGAHATGKVHNDDRSDWAGAWALSPAAVAYVWHAGRHASEVSDSLKSAAFIIRAQIIWAKTRLIISRGHYHQQHEPCWYAVRKGGKGHWQGSRKETTLWTIEHRKSETGHSTQKPIECMRRPIENSSAKDDAVYDPFLGSGTTIIAAEQTGRRCYGMEIAPEYCDVAVRRWQAFTGKEAVLDGDVRTFAEVAAERIGSKAA